MKKNRINVIIIIACAVIILFFIFMVDSPQTILKALTAAKPLYLLLAALCMIVYWLLEAGVLGRICHATGSRLPFKDCFQVSMIGQLFNCLTPFASGGQPMQAYRLNKRGISIGQASCALLAKFIVYQSVLTVYTLVIIIFQFNYFLENVSGFTVLVLFGFTANTIIMAMIIGVGFFPRLTKKLLFGLVRFLHKIRLVKRLEHLEERIETETKQFYTDFAILKAAPSKFFLPALLSVIQLTAFFTVPYFVSVSLGAKNLNYVTVISAAALVLLISSFVPLPGGSGGAEGGFYVFFSIFFHQPGTLAVAMILWRILTFYFPIGAGMCFLKFTKTEENGTPTNSGTKKT